MTKLHWLHGESSAYNCSSKYPPPNSDYVYSSSSMRCGATSAHSNRHIGESSPQALFSSPGWVIVRRSISFKEMPTLTTKIQPGPPVMDLAITIGHGCMYQSLKPGVLKPSMTPGLRNHWFSQCTPHPGQMHFTVCCLGWHERKGQHCLFLLTISPFPRSQCLGKDIDTSAKNK